MIFEKFFEDHFPALLKTASYKYKMWQSRFVIVLISRIR